MYVKLESIVGPGTHLKDAFLIIKREPGGVEMAGSCDEVGRDPDNLPLFTEHHSVISVTGQELPLTEIVNLHVRSPDIIRIQPDITHLVQSIIKIREGEPRNQPRHISSYSSS